MSKKDLKKELSEKADERSTVGNMTRQDEDTEPSVFYRCVCPNCGEDALNVIDSGVFTRSPALGITSDGEIGCSRTEVDGDYELGLHCRACGHQVCSDHSFANKCEDEFLSEWVKSNGNARSTLAFACPKCDSPELHKVEIGIEFSTAVVAVCEPDSPGNEPLVAVSHLREIDNRGSYRYRCSRGHELAKDDGAARLRMKETWSSGSRLAALLTKDNPVNLPRQRLARPLSGSSPKDILHAHPSVLTN